MDKISGIADKRCTLLMLTLVASVLSLWASPAAAGTITVGKGTAASCTDEALYQAVELARASGGATIRFRCGGTPVTIGLTREMLVIPDNTKINGGEMVTLTTARQCQIFGTLLFVEAGSTVVLANLTLGPFSECAPMLINEGTLVFNSSTLIGLGGHLKTGHTWTGQTRP